jgi:hypothetical protein
MKSKRANPTPPTERSRKKLELKRVILRRLTEQDLGVAQGGSDTPINPRCWNPFYSA